MLIHVIATSIRYGSASELNIPSLTQFDRMIFAASMPSEVTTGGSGNLTMDSTE